MRSLLRPVVLALAAALAAPIGGCRRSAQSSSNTSASATARAPQRYEVAEQVYEGKLQSGWQDYGWSPRDLGKGPASVDFGKWGGWIVAKPGLEGRYGALVFRTKTPNASTPAPAPCATASPPAPRRCSKPRWRAIPIIRKRCAGWPSC